LHFHHLIGCASTERVPLPVPRGGELFVLALTP